MKRNTTTLKLALTVIGISLIAAGPILAAALPPAPPPEDTLPDCGKPNGEIIGQPCKVGTVKHCLVRSIERCVSCTDSNGDGKAHWGAPHACSETILDNEFDLDGARFERW